MPAGWCSWFVAGLVRLRLWVLLRPKSVDFHDAENRQRPCRMTMRARLLIRQVPMGPSLFRSPPDRVLFSVSAPETGYRAPEIQLPSVLHVV
ncbi:hypothetical protein TNCV_679461 [Trichonephila clavipes]|nr:hypothetical protein TNCV_679461 [Trichonephila clavipes]